MHVAIPIQRINFRGELRVALLAAGESCWLYAIILTVSTLAGFQQVISPFGIFVLYLTGLFVGRLLPRYKKSWRVLQILTVVCAFLAILVAMRVGFYTNLPFYDFTWLGTYLGRIFTLFERFTAEVLSTLLLVIAFIRALNLAERPLTLWVVGFQFRLGIVIFFVVALLAAISVQVDFVFWIFMYFSVSLIGISLARIEEAGQERPLGGKWALVMLTIIGVTMLLGFGATQFLTLEAVNALFALLSPLWFVLRIIATIIAIPFLYLIEFLVRLLEPLIAALTGILAELFRTFRINPQETNELLREATRQLIDLMPYLRLLGVIAVALLVAWFIARSLSRRVKWREQEVFATEAVDERQELLLEKRKRPSKARSRQHEIHAETIRRIYAALLVQAETLGLKRREAETPLEFLPRLTARLPGSAHDFRTITDAYVAVHYAQHNATDDQVRDIRAVWQRTKERMIRLAREEGGKRKR